MEQRLNFDDVNNELRWFEVQDALDDFQSLLSDHLPRFCIQRNEDVLDWKRQNGVYLLFGQQQQLLYIGFTLNGFGTRNKSHKRNKSYRWIDLIVFPEDCEFFAPSLEVFLRRRLLPQLDEGGNYI